MKRKEIDSPKAAPQSQRASLDAMLFAIAPPSIVGLLVWYSAGIGYLLAHTIAELFSIVIAFTALVVAITARKFTRNQFVVFVSVAIGWCAALDLIHTLVFKGMRLIESDSANPATQLWIAARSIQAVAMVIAPLMLTRTVRLAWLQLAFGSVSILAVVAIFTGRFPDAFIDGQGLTPFKISAEYAIMSLLAIALLFLWSRRSLTTPKMLWGMTASLIAMIVSEFAFTQYASAYAPSNLLGHILKIYAYWFVYVALVQTTLQDPFSMLSRAASTYDAVPDPTLIIAADGTILQANKAAAAKAGVPAEQLVGESSHAHFHDARMNIEACPVCAMLGTNREYFSKAIDLPGYQCVECSVAPFANGREGDARVQVVRDITEQHASEVRFRKLFEDTGQPIMLVEDGHFIAANRASLAMLRMQSQEEFLRKTPLDISPELQPDGRRSSEKVLEVIATAFERGSNEFEWEHIRADGEHFIARVLLTPIRMGGKELLHVVWSDITRQKIAERELQESHHTLERRVRERTAELESLTVSLRNAGEQQQAVFDAATVGIILTRDRLILRCNRTMERLFGYETDELNGKTTRLLYPDDATYNDLTVRLMENLTSKGFFREERPLVRKDGTTFWCREMVQAIDRTDLGKGFAGTFEDITPERDAMDELARARTLAEDAARAKADFLANMSHEIRTPMNSVMGMTHLALRAAPPPKVKDYLEKIQSSGQHLLGVINDILDFSKLEADRMTLERAPFELEDVLDGVINVFAEKAATKGVELIVHVTPDVPASLVGDSLRVEQILINLTSNAVKFTEQGDITIRVALHERSGDHVILRFSIRDTGIGLSAEQCSRLFRSFQQADSSTTRKYGGTGLGLVISKHLVELMDGQIGVDSNLGEGSTFWFTARFGVGSENSDRYKVHPDLHGMRTLVVDDNEQARQVIVEMLLSMGFEAVAVDVGEKALSEIERAEEAGTPYDIVFLDWKMPGMDGIDVAREIHRKPLKEPPLVLMITAFDRDEVLPSARQVGIREVLVKPVTPSALFNSVMHQFGKASDMPRPSDSPDDALAKSVELSGARALLVEDNDLNQQVATEFLRALGLEVDLAEDGLAAIDKVRRNQYDVVLMDMQMPVMDGLTATREIRKLPDLVDLPILAMTANAMAGDRDRCLAAGMNDHIAKPIDPADLVAKLKRWVKQPSGRRKDTITPQAPDAHPAARDFPDDDLRGIAGLDAAQGLRQVMGRAALYRNLLAKFVSGERDFHTRIADALAQGKPDEAERLAHTLKGVAAQIGAAPVRDLAERLEHALHRHEPAEAITPLIQEASHQLSQLIEAICAHLPDTQAAVATVPVDPLLWEALRGRLEALLREDDAESEQLFEDNLALIRAALGPRYQQFAVAMAAYDFPSALRALEHH